jgi:hypothetical protein
MRTERSTVTLALAGFCALGALSAVIPAVAVLLLALLGLGVLAGIVAVVVAWRRTRYQAPEPVRHLAIPTNTNRADDIGRTARKEVA